MLSPSVGPGGGFGEKQKHCWLVGGCGTCWEVLARSGSWWWRARFKSAEFEQWELFDRSGQVDARRVRSEHVGPGRVEGCVADDELGRLYLAQEDIGIWRYGAEPDDRSARFQVDSTGSRGQLFPTSRDSRSPMPARDPATSLPRARATTPSRSTSGPAATNFVDRFRITAGGARDGAEVTDGIDVTTANLGPPFPQGVFVAQDGENDGASQNYKLVPWNAIIS